MGASDAFLGIDLGGTKVLALVARPVDGTTLASAVAETPSRESAKCIVVYLEPVREQRAAVNTLQRNCSDLGGWVDQRRCREADFTRTAEP